MNQSLKQALVKLGFLRLGLLGFTLVNAIYALLRSLPASSPVAEQSAQWKVIFGVVAPTLAPLLLVVLFFDYLMSRVRAADAEGELREQFLLISRVELAVMLFLMLAWVPFFVTLYR